MFLDKEFFLANELLEFTQMHIANASMIKKELLENDSGGVVKRGNCLFFSKTSKELPNNIKELLAKHGKTLHTFENKVPITALRSEFSDVGTTALLKGFEKAGVSITKEEISGKTFVVFPDEFVSKLKNKTPYILNETEYKSSLKNQDIDGGIYIKKNKYFVWY